MPRMNGASPAGQGAITGRRMERCANNGAGVEKNENVQNLPKVETERNIEQRSAGQAQGQGQAQGLGRGRGQKGKGLGVGKGMGLDRQVKGIGRGNRQYD